VNQQTKTDQSNEKEDFDPQPHITGDLVELRPIRSDDWEDLLAAASDPMIWEQHPIPDRYKPEIFSGFFREALESGGALVIIDRETQKIIGSSRYNAFDADKREVEIGWSFLARSYWGGKYNREVKRLMLNHAFRFVDNVVFLIGPTNVRSQKAVEKIGGVPTDKRVNITIEGRTIEHIVYRITKSAFAVSNLNASGRT
jgi:RimJ/RimL family protein N-acetyltransferase